MSDALVIWTRWIIRTAVACLALAALSLLLISVSRTRDAAQRITCKNHLKQFLLALHNYHDNFEVFPPGGTFHDDGRAHHGWGVAIWPYYESGPWYNQIDMKRPWDVGTNAGIAHIRHSGFIIPGVDSTPEPTEYGMAHYSANSHLMSANRFVSLTKVPDTESMFIIAELSGDFVPWACPYNWRPLEGRLNADPPTYGRPTHDGAFFGMVSGSVRFVENHASPAILDALRGPDLADYGGMGKSIVRPKSFRCPPDLLEPVKFYFEREFFPRGWRDIQGRIVEMDYYYWDMGRGDPKDGDFFRLSEYPELRRLDARGTFTDGAFAALPRLEQLEKLRLHSDFITENGLRRLTKQPRLKSLTVSGKQITTETVERLSRLLPNCEIRSVNSRED